MQERASRGEKSHFFPPGRNAEETLSQPVKHGIIASSLRLEAFEICVPQIFGPGAGSEDKIVLYLRLDAFEGCILRIFGPDSRKIGFKSAAGSIP